MAGLFIDTWGWLAMRDQSDAGHAEAVAAIQAALSAKEVALTTDYVLDETFTLLFRRLPSAKAMASAEFLLGAVEEGPVSLVFANLARFREAVRLRFRYKDKPELSFTDFTSMAVMREFGLKRVLTEDRHFAQVRMGLPRVP
jgi:predicted nucleic acid-binding protein